MACQPQRSNRKTLFPNVELRPAFVPRTLYKYATQNRTEQLASHSMCRNVYDADAGSLPPAAVGAQLTNTQSAGVPPRLKQLFPLLSLVRIGVGVTLLEKGSEISHAPASVSP